MGLHMITDGVPAIVFRSFHYPGPNRIQVDVGQAVDQCLALFHNDTFKTFSPEKAAPMVAAVVKAGKPHLNLFNKLGQAGILLSKKRNLLVA